MESSTPCALGDNWDNLIGTNYLLSKKISSKSHLLIDLLYFATLQNWEYKGGIVPHLSLICCNPKALVTLDIFANNI